MQKFLDYVEYAKEYTESEQAEIVCKRNNDTWFLIVCINIDDDGYFQCWLLRMWDNPFSNKPNIKVEYYNTTTMENAATHVVEISKAIAMIIVK